MRRPFLYKEADHSVFLRQRACAAPPLRVYFHVWHAALRSPSGEGANDQPARRQAPLRDHIIRYPRLRNPTSTTAEAATAATTAAATFHFPPLPLLPLPSPFRRPGSSFKKADAPLRATSVDADSPKPPPVPKFTSLLVRDMLREARESDRLGVRGPSSGKTHGYICMHVHVV